MVHICTFGHTNPRMKKEITNKTEKHEKRKGNLFTVVYHSQQTREEKEKQDTCIHLIP